MYSIELRHQAKSQKAEIVAWYEDINPRYAREFVDELEQTIEKYLTKTPYQWRKTAGNKRRILLKKYPYKVIYTINETQKQVQILAIWHHKRKEWQKAKH